MRKHLNLVHNLRPNHSNGTICYLLSCFQVLNSNLAFFRFYLLLTPKINTAFLPPPQPPNKNKQVLFQNMPSICWWDHQQMVHWKPTHPGWGWTSVRCPRNSALREFPKLWVDPAVTFIVRLGEPRFWERASFFLKVDPKPGENVGFKGLKVWWLVGWSFSSDASFFFRVFFWWWCFSLAKEKLKLYNSCFFFPKWIQMYLY